MKAEEQIYAYKELKKNGQAFFVSTYEDADRIIEALEKQIPKKPKYNKYYYEWFSRVNTYTCPTCGNVLLTKKMNDRQDTSYCWDCGQRLDWSDEDK